jgi:ABC-type branched-subunit amino acid transport system substrate-binding protein
MYNQEQLEADINKIGQEKLVLAVPWHRSRKSDESPFEKSSRQLWSGALINWRTAMAYDATKAMIEGLSKLGNNLTRSGLYEQLSKSNFSIQGATGKVEFDKNHDRKSFKGIGVLVHVQPDANNKPVFVRLEQPSTTR